VIGEIVSALRDPWVAVGFVGQTFFFSRFVIQWIVSERRGETIIPPAFWYLSIGGGLVLLIYAVHQRDPVFIAGQGMGSFIYFRNLILVNRKKKAGAVA
jgi:lipid-A-disaccharide synthase-like uncharacterized protein